MPTPALEIPKGKTSKVVTISGKKLIDKKIANRASEDHLPKRPPVKTPLSALLSKTPVKSGDVNLMLVTVTVLGSPGPLRFLVDRADNVARVIETALRAYAREGRLPLLNCKLVELYCDNGDFKALNPLESVGSLETRQFLLYRKNPKEMQDERKGNVQSISHPLKHWWSFMSSLVCSH